MPTLEKQGYKYTEEFGYIPEDWEVKNIIKTSNLKARIGWQGLTTAEYLNNGDYLLVTGTDFDNGKINWQSCFYVEKKRYDQDTNIQLKNGDVLITKDGTIGKVAYIDKLPKPTTLNSGVFVVRPLNEAYNTKYFYYLLQSNIFISFLNKLKAGSTIVHLYQKDLSNFDYIIPSDIQEQEKIAEVLGDVDSLIDKTQQLINKKKDLKTATMQKLLIQKEDWEVKNIDELCINLDNLRIPLNDSQREEGIYPYCGANGIVDYINKWCIDDDIVLIAEDGGYFDEYKTRPIAYKMSGKCWVNNHAHVLKAKSGYSQDFIFYSLVHKNILNYITGGTRAKLNKEILLKIEIFIPKEFREQEQIATILSDMDSEIEALEKELNKYKDLKTGMMQQLLTGKVRLI